MKTIPTTATDFGAGAMLVKCLEVAGNLIRRTRCINSGGLSALSLRVRTDPSQIARPVNLVIRVGITADVGLIVSAGAVGEVLASGRDLKR